MKVIKEFIDHEFMKNSDPDSIWIWGLGDDGWVYYRCSSYSNPDKWYIYGYSLPLKTMCKIVKEFGHLLTWI